MNAVDARQVGSEASSYVVVSLLGWGDALSLGGPGDAGGTGVLCRGVRPDSDESSPQTRIVEMDEPETEPGVSVDMLP